MTNGVHPQDVYYSLNAIHIYSQQRLHILLLPSGVAEAEQTSAAATGLGFALCICVCVCLIHTYRGRWRQDDVADGGFELVDGGSVLVRAVVRLNGFDFYVELPGFVFIFRVAGWIEGILFGMWAKRTKLRRQQECNQQQLLQVFLFRPSG